MSERARKYTTKILDGIAATRNAMDIQRLLEVNALHLRILAARAPEQHDRITSALENRRAYLAQEPL